MERMKRRVALVLVMAMLLSVVPVFSGAPVQAQTLGKNDMEDGFLVSEMVGDGLNGEGVWVTEVYNNDVNRSRAEDTRVSGGYVPITVYDTTSDLMEFLEVVSTHDEPIAFNDLYEITVADRKLTVTTMDGSSDVVLTRDQVVVLWHYRTDLTVKVPTEAEFRAAMKIPEDALLLKCTDGTGWDATGTVSVRDKTTGETTCTFTTEAGVHVSDGHSVELKLPLMGSTMEAYRVCTMPTPGIVTLTQVRGLMYSDMDETTGKGLYITEIRPNDISRSAQFGLGNDLMECQADPEPSGLPLRR